MHLHKSYYDKKASPAKSRPFGLEALCIPYVRFESNGVARRHVRGQKAKQKVRHACRAKLIIDKAINL